MESSSIYKIILILTIISLAVLSFSCEDTLGTDPSVVKNELNEKDEEEGTSKRVKLNNFTWEIKEMYESSSGEINYTWDNVSTIESYCLVDSISEQEQIYWMEIKVNNNLPASAVIDRNERVKQISLKVDSIALGTHHLLNEDNPGISIEIFRETISEKKTYLLDRFYDYFASFIFEYDKITGTYRGELHVEFPPHSPELSTRFMIIKILGEK